MQTDFGFLAACGLLFETVVLAKPIVLPSIDQMSRQGKFGSDFTLYCFGAARPTSQHVTSKVGFVRLADCGKFRLESCKLEWSTRAA
jgi:hypothetical protein